MMKKTVITLIILASVGLNVYLLARTETPGYNFRLENDTRTAFQVKPEHREFVMREMRLFVESIQLVNEGIQEKDPQKIIQAAAQSGTSVDPPKELVASVPKGFLAMGRPTHKLFDDMADSAKVNFRPELAEKQLTTQLNNCIACHKTYKMEVLTNSPSIAKLFASKGK